MMPSPNTPQLNEENKPVLVNDEAQRFLPSALQNASEKTPLQPLVREEQQIITSKKISKLFAIGTGVSIILSLTGAILSSVPFFMGGCLATIACLSIADFAKINQLKLSSSLLQKEDVSSAILLLNETPEQLRWAVKHVPHIRLFTQQYYQLNATHILSEYDKFASQFPILREDQLFIYRLRKQIDTLLYSEQVVLSEPHKGYYYTSHKKATMVAFFKQHFHRLFEFMPRDYSVFSNKECKQQAFAYTFAYLQFILYLGAPAYLFTNDVFADAWTKVEVRYNGDKEFMSGDTTDIRKAAKQYYNTLLPEFIFIMQKYTNLNDFFTTCVNHISLQFPAVPTHIYEKIQELSAAAFFSACALNKQIDAVLFENAEQAFAFGELPALQFYLQRNPQNAYSALLMHSTYEMHFLTSAKQGLAVLRETHLNTSYFTQLSFFQNPATFHVPLAVSVSDLPVDTLQQFLNVLQTFRAELLPHAQKELRTAEQRLSFSVWLAGYACFFADVLTPTVDFGPQFLQHYLQDLQKELYIPPEQIPQFLEMFQKAYFCFAEPAETIFANDDVRKMIEGYVRLFMASAGVTSTALESNLRNQTVALLPACEMALLPNDL